MKNFIHGPTQTPLPLLLGGGIALIFVASAVAQDDPAALPAPSRPVLVDGSDTGREAHDGVTSSRTPSFTGTAPAGTTVELRAADRLVGSTSLDDESEQWTITPARPLEDGEYRVTARSIRGDQRSDESTAGEVTVDTSPPSAPSMPALAPDSDTGTSRGDGLTQDATPILTGRAEPASQIELLLGDDLAGTTPADEDGVWIFELTQPLSDGEHRFRARATDAAGNQGSASETLRVTIDTQPPPPPVLRGFADDTGELGDHVTADASLHVDGLADDARFVTAYFNGANQGSTEVSPGGTFTFAAPVQPRGQYEIVATAHDAAGNVSQRSQPLTVTIEPDALPTRVGFVLLLPAILALLARAFMSWWPRSAASRGLWSTVEYLRGSTVQVSPSCDRRNADFNPGLIMIILTSWLIVLWWLDGKIWDDVVFYSPKLNIPIFVPVFGLLGAMTFIIDVFRKGQNQPDVDVGKEFAWRLLLGPYVAIVTVFLFTGPLGEVQFDELEGLDPYRRQAVLAFFSGFLVVLLLQWLTEVFNTWLGLLRDATRYEKSEVAREFGLDKEDDLKLRKAGIKQVRQLRELQGEQVAELARRTPVDQQLLQPLVEQASREGVIAAIGSRAWKALKEQTEIQTIEDVAALPQGKLKECAAKCCIREDQLEKFWRRCRDVVDEQDAKRDPR